MNNRLRVTLLMAGLFAACLCNASVTGNVATRVDYFPSAPVSESRSGGDLQLALTTTLDTRRNLGDKAAVALSVFGKFNPNADQDGTAEVREAWIAHYRDNSEWRAGLLLERWGVLEAHNMVDVINPRDAVEDFQGGVRRSVPGLSLSLLGDTTTLTAWWLPYARERRLARGDDRYRTLPLPLADAQFENGRRHDALAVRASAIVNDTELAIAHFYGHERMPRFEALVDAAGTPVALEPHYDLINQTSVEVLRIQGDLLWKLEGLYQQSDRDSFFAFGAGVEKEWPRLGDSNVSLSLFSELYYDGRDESTGIALTPFQQDLFLGARLALNDINSTEFQVRLTTDLEYHSTLLDLRAARRLNRVWSMEASLNAFVNAKSDPALRQFRQDHLLRLQLTRGF